MNAGALSGIRVLDLTQALAGPFCTQLLADHGAEVIKIEAPSGGDMSRGAGPYHPADTKHEQCGYFHSVNRNKKGLALDLKSVEGRDVFLKLAETADVIVENFRAGVMDRLGLSYEICRSRNPRLVYATIRGFGDPRSGASPYVDWPSYDVVAQAMGGIMSVTGPDDAHPTKVGPGIGDTVPALFLSFGILAAILHARETGEGQFVDVAMVDAILSISERLVFQHSFAKVIPSPDGNHHPYWAPFGTFSAKDGHVALACTSDEFFRELCTALDAPEILDDPRFRSLGRRRHTRIEVIEAIEQVTKRFTKAELYKRLGGRVPFGPVYRMDEIASDPHFATREMLVPIELPGIPEPVEIAGIPVKLSATPGHIARRGPNLGEHTDEVLGRAGFSPEQIEQLRRSSAIK